MLFRSADAKYDYFHRDYGNSGHRFRVQPVVKLPVKTDFLTFIPSVGIDHTSYSLTNHEGTGNSTITDSGGRTEILNTNATKDGFQARTTWAAGFTAFSEMTRVFNLSDEIKAEPSLAGTSEWTRLKHSIVPRVKYEYTPTITGQDKLPYFDKYEDRKSVV